MSWFKEKLPSRKGMTHSYVNYKSSQSSHSYESKTEEIVRFPGKPTITDYEHLSPRKDFVSKPFLMPWVSIPEQPDRHEAFSPKFGQDVVHGKDTGLPRKNSYKENSPPGRDHELGKFSSFRRQEDDTDSDDDDDYDYVCNEDGVCVKNYKNPVSKPNHLIDEGYARNNDKYRTKGSETNYEQTTRPRRQTYYDKSYDDLDLEKEKGSFNAPKYTANNYSFPSSNHPKPDAYYEKNPPYYTEKDHGNLKTHVAPSYSVPPSNQPKREPYYGTSYTNTTQKEKEKTHAGYSHSAPSSNQPKKDAYYDKAPTYNDKRHENGYIPPYTVPATTIPRKEQKQYERSNSGPMVMMNPPPIRTSRGRDTDYYNENGRNNSPLYNSPSRKDHQGYGKTIEEVEPRWRYGKGQPLVESYVEETHTRVIDAREAARRYKGVLLTS